MTIHDCGSYGWVFVQMVFTNETSGEYQFYELTMRAGRPGVIAAINLVTPVRRSVSHTLTLDNPLSYPVTLNATCNVAEVLLPGPLQVPAMSEVCTRHLVHALTICVFYTCHCYFRVSLPLTTCPSRSGMFKVVWKSPVMTLDYICMTWTWRPLQQALRGPCTLRQP